jgi:transposase InsO family protein
MPLPAASSAGGSAERPMPGLFSMPSNRPFISAGRRGPGASLGSRIAISVHRYTERLAEAGIEPSVGSVGDSYDNALAETINGLFKAEVIHRRGPWRSFEAVEYATLEWVDWFNNRRLLEPIGNIPPAEAEANFYAALERSDMAA